MWYREELIMSNLTKKKLFSISNAVKHYAYSLIDENGEWNDRGMKVVSVIGIVLLFVVFYLEGGI